ncbi:17710_t:CDS:2 [Entrophospora sp. SA101]|nr:17710_t:CDS:2 [Entrophospora sp. SA101]
MSKNNSIILNKSTAPKPSIPFTILPSPFQTVIVISAAQYQQAIQKTNELDNEIKNTGVNLTLIQEVSKKKKIDYSNIISELIPLYAKINRLIPLYYIVTKNNDMAARNLITMKYRIQQQIISLPDELFFLRIDELQRHKELLYQLEKYEPELEKLQNSGGYIAYGDSFGQLSSQVGDLFVPNQLNKSIKMPPKKKETKQKLTDFWSTNKNEGDSTQPKKKLKHNNATTTNDTHVINITDDNNDKEKPKQQEKSQFEQDEDLDELLSLSYQEVEGGAEVEEDDNITAIGTSASTNIGVTTNSSIATSSSSSYSVGSEIRSKLVFHYDDLSEEERILIAFDMDYTYGPCVGLTRLQRWNRACKLGLQPPAQVKELLSGPCTTNLIECVFYGRLSHRVSNVDPTIVFSKTFEIGSSDVFKKARVDTGKDYYLVCHTEITTLTVSKVSEFLSTMIN